MYYPGYVHGRPSIPHSFRGVPDALSSVHPMSSRPSGQLPNSSTRTLLRQQCDNLIKNGLLNEAEDVLLEYQKNGAPFEVVTWNKLMSEYKRKDNWQEVLRVLRRLEHSGKPDTVTYNIAIDACGKAQQLHWAFDCFEAMKRARLPRTVNTFTSLIDAASKVGNVQLAFQMLHVMSTERIRPNACTFTTLVNGCVQTGSLALGLLVLERMTEFVSDDVESYDAPYISLIRAASKQLDMCVAFSALDAMLRVGLVPSLSIFNYLIEHSGKARRLDLAHRAFGLIVFHGGRPDAATFAAMIGVCCWLGHVDHTYLLFQEVCRSGLWLGAKPTPVCSLLVGGAARWRRTDLAFKMLDEMARRGLFPQADALSTLMDACVQLERPDQALQVLHYLRNGKLRPTRAIFSALLRACSGRGLLEILDAHGINLSMTDLTRVVFESCIDTRAFGAAHELLTLVKRSELLPNPAVANGLLAACITAGELEWHFILQTEFCKCGVPLNGMLSQGYLPYPIAHPLLVHPPADPISQLARLISRAADDSSPADAQVVERDYSADREAKAGLQSPIAECAAAAEATAAAEVPASNTTNCSTQCETSMHHLYAPAPATPTCFREDTSEAEKQVEGLPAPATASSASSPESAVTSELVSLCTTSSSC